jgi:hypothetical protein
VNRDGAPRPILTTSDALPVIADTLPVEQLRRLLFKAVALPVGMMLLLCALLGWQVATLMEESDVVAASQRTIGEAYEVQSLLLALGYPATGDRAHAAYEQLPVRLGQLRALVELRPDQRERVAAIETEYRAWSAVSASSGSVDVAGQSVARVREQQIAAMLGASAEVIAAESELLSAREREAARHRRRTIVGGAALLLAFGAFMATFLRRWFRTMEHTYAKALARSVQSEAGERAARQAAEALAGEVTAQSKELATRLTKMRRELVEARAHRREA